MLHRLTRRRLEQRSFLIALVRVTLLFLYLRKPFFMAVFWACVIGMVFHPMNNALSRRWGTPTLASLALCLLVGIIPTLVAATGGAEGLVRWRYPELWVLSAEQFIPMA